MRAADVIMVILILINIFLGVVWDVPWLLVVAAVLALLGAIVRRDERNSIE